MNAKTDFKELPMPHAVSPNSPEGQKTIACLSVFGGLANLAGMQVVMNGFAFFFASTSLECGMDDDTFENAMKEWNHIARVNRGNMQSRRTGQKS